MQAKGIDDVLAQLRAMAALAGTRPPSTAGAAAPGSADFAQLLKGALDQVARSQGDATALARDYELGRGEAGLHDVMLAMQKANISFQATVQVRNRLVQAYQEIMNMQV